MATNQFVVNQVYDGSTGYILIENFDPIPKGYQIIVEWEEDAFEGYVETFALASNIALN